MNNKRAKRLIEENSFIVQVKRCYVKKGDTKYNITLYTSKDNCMYITCQDIYSLRLSFEELYPKSILFRQCTDVHEIFKAFTSCFLNNKFKITEIIELYQMTLALRIKKTKETFEFTLFHKNNQNGQNNQNNINNVESEQENSPKKNILNKKKPRNNKINFSTNNISDIKKNINLKNYKIIANDNAFNQIQEDNTFIVFTSLSNISFLVYASQDHSIILYNISTEQKITKIKNAHKKNITSFRYTALSENNKEIIMSISFDHNIKLWDIDNLICLLDLKIPCIESSLFTACFLRSINSYYIINFNRFSENEEETLKIYDLKGRKTKEISNIKKSDEKIYFIDIFYDDHKVFIIIGNNYNIKTFDYHHNKIYREYNDNKFSNHCSIVISNNENKTKLIESRGCKYVKVWDFHEANLIKRIKINDNNLFGICLWDENSLAVGCSGDTIELVDIKSGEVIKSLTVKNANDIYTIKKAKHEKLGDCLISQGINNPIILWSK